MAENPLKAMSDEQLVHGLLAKERDLVASRFRHSMNQLENTATLRVIRKEIARMKTEIRAREIASGAQHGSLAAKFGRAAAAPAGGAAEQAPAERGGFLKGIVDRLTGKE